MSEAAATICERCRQPMTNCLCTIVGTDFSRMLQSENAHADMVIQVMLSAIGHGVEIRRECPPDIEDAITLRLAFLLVVINKLITDAISQADAEVQFGDWLADIAFQSGGRFDTSLFLE
jgi:hypothetical protein